ncbi:MAG: hypothetical protein KBA75_02425 [Alphaproteobacteria bacterium]|nr:hypothetical protein [Alphaproteobacteria bacterium]
MAGQFRVNDQPAAPFATVTELVLTVQPEKRAQLVTFSSPTLSETEYRAFDLPMTVGRLSPTQRGVFAPDPALGRFEYSATGMIDNYPAQPKEAFVAAAQGLLCAPDRLLPGSRHDKERHRFQPGEEDRVMRRVTAQVGLVADIFALDQALVGGQKVSVAAEFVQDRPSPWQALARQMHADGLGMPGPLHRSYVVRSVYPPEFIRDQVVYAPLAQDPVCQALQRGEYVPDPVINPWLAKAKLDGLAIVPNPYEVVLMSRQKTLHRSQVPERLDQVVPSTYLRVMVAPCTY